MKTKEELLKMDLEELSEELDKARDYRILVSAVHTLKSTWFEREAK